LTTITCFSTEHYNYKREFIFKGEPLRVSLHKLGQMIFGFLSLKNESSGTISISGLITDEEIDREV